MAQVIYLHRAIPCAMAQALTTMELVPVPLVPTSDKKWVYKAVNVLLVFHPQNPVFVSVYPQKGTSQLKHPQLSKKGFYSPIYEIKPLRWGWVFLERTRILSGIQFTTYFIVVVVEMKRFVGSFVHVILTRQTCGQRSSRAAESKRRALGNYFSERICYMFLISKCRGD